MFGADYHYEKQPKILNDGIYEVILELPFETKVVGCPVLRFPFKVDGKNELVVPNYFDLYKYTNPYDYFQVSRFRESASKIKACFKLPGAFSSENYAKWVGCKGKVMIKKSENGFVYVSYFYKAEMAKYED